MGFGVNRVVRASKARSLHRRLPKVLILADEYIRTYSIRLPIQATRAGISAIPTGPIQIPCLAVYQPGASDIRRLPEVPWYRLELGAVRTVKREEAGSKVKFGEDVVQSTHLSKCGSIKTCKGILQHQSFL